MSKLSIPVLAFVMLGISAFGQSGWRPREMEVKVFLETNKQAEFLQSTKFNGDIYPNGVARLYLTPKEFELLKKQGIKYEIIEEDLNSRQTIWDKTAEYHSYQEIIDVMDSLQTAFPDMVQKTVAGYSVEGRELAYLKISDNVSIDETEPEVCLDAGYHGDEVGGPENVIRFARDICLSYGEDATITDLIDNHEIFLYIMVNPDGRYNDTRYNANGIDLNRDFGYMWDGDGGSQGFYSQIENKVFRDFVLENQFTIQITYHSGIEYVIYPWGYRAGLTPDNSHLDVLGNLYADQSGYSNIPVGPINTSLYGVNGGSSDGYYGIMGSAGHCVELSNDKHPSGDDIIYFYNINYQPMIDMIASGSKGMHGMVVDAETGNPVAATIFVDDLYGVFSDPVVGDFHKYLLAGTYDIKVKANGYEDYYATGLSIGENGTDIGSIEMTPSSNNMFAYKVISCQIPGNNEADEGFTQSIIGSSDNESYSIGKNGIIVFEMFESIIDGNGPDIRIHEGDADAEGYTLYASETPDGPWYNLGDGNGTSEFDLANANVMEAKYFKMVDDGDGSANVAGAGFDFDAAEHLPGQPGVYLLLEGISLVETSGNGNGRIDPGEEFDFTVSLLNMGDGAANNTTGVLTVDSELVTITNEIGDFGSIEIEGESNVTYQFSVSEDAQTGDAFSLTLNISANAGDYTNSFGFSYPIGLVMEDFESGGFTSFDWNMSGAANWEISESEIYEGSYSAVSGNIDDSEATVLQIELNVPVDDAISFYKKVSSESTYDFLIFSIDGTEMGSWSGEVDWSQESFEITSGQHTVTWTYDKDVSVSDGSDCAWIDNIVLPGGVSYYNDVTVSINSITEICQNEEFQLEAMPTGGNGNYTYSWTPAELLDDATIPNPTAQIEETTTFTVEVTDGTSTATAQAEVVALDRPETPVIELVGDELVSSSENGNQWYMDDEPVEGATNQTYSPTQSGTYSVMVSNDNCSSDMSNEIEVTVGVGELNELFSISPNPSNGVFNITSNGKIIDEISVLDVSGKVLFHNPVLTRQVELDLSNNKNGMYFIRILSGNVIRIHKIVKY